MAWLSNYSNRKELVLTGGASGAQTNFQLKITVSYAAAMQGDFDDLRFTQADGTTLVDAWAEVIVTDTSTTVWVEFPTTPANTVEQTYYMYYGKVVANYWDIGNTFIFGEDFNSYNTASLIGQGSWAEWESGSNHDVSETFAKETGGKSYRSEFNSSYSGAYHSFTNQTGLFAVDWDVLFDSSSAANQGQGLAIGDVAVKENRDGACIIAKRNAANNNNELVYRSDAGYENLQNINYDTWYKVTCVINPTTQNIKIYVDDGSVLYNGDMKGSVTDFDMISLQWYTSSAVVFHDQIRIRKYAANPPTYTFGSEESLFIPTIIIM